MRFSKALFFTILIAISGATKTTGQTQPACETPEGKQFDFWLGEWALTWEGGQAGVPEEEIGRATNVVTKVLGSCIVREQFTMPGYEGLSFSAFKSQTGKWHQTWVDSHGGYIALTGEFKNGRMELRTEPFPNQSGEEQINRMLFSDIKENSLLWRWQRSVDGGETWEDAWVIRYERIEAASN